MNIRISPLDILFSEFIRRRAIINSGGCEFCGKQLRDITKDNGEILPAWKQLECSHFHSRRFRNTRYDPDNCIGLCFTCHMFLGGNPYAHTKFFEKRLGTERLEQLSMRANLIAPKEDKEKIKTELKEKIRLLGHEEYAL